MNPGEIPFNDNNNNNHDRHANIFLPRPNAQFNVFVMCFNEFIEFSVGR